MNKQKRIISLLPSTTEIVAALGSADQLVGRMSPRLTVRRILAEGTHPSLDETLLGNGWMLFDG